MHNALAHVQAKLRPAVMAVIQTTFVQSAHAQWKTVAGALRERAPKLAELMDEAHDDVLTYMGFPTDGRPQIASSNPLDCNGEIKRRSNLVGIFPNDRAVIRLTGALRLNQNDEWSISCDYMSLESLPSVTDDPLVTLPCVATRSTSDRNKGRCTYTTSRGTLKWRRVRPAIHLARLPATAPHPLGATKRASPL
jgi:putative transposase